MAQSEKHYWNFEKFDARSLWLFNTPSSFSQSLGLYILEMGHFYQDGHCYTHRIPKSSFILSFPQKNACDSDTSIEMRFLEKSYSIPPSIVGQYVALSDNAPGYITETTGRIENYFIEFGGFMAEKYCQLLLGDEHLKLIPVNWISSLIDMFENLSLLYRQPSNERKDVYASMLLTQILSRLILGVDPNQPLYAENSYVKRTLAIIEERFYENIKLKDIADELHVNASYLSRLIANETGTTFSSCITHVRLNHAKELLQTSNFSIEEIGIRCGFCNASHFVKLFHASEKMTPLQYRVMHRQDIFKLNPYS